MALDNLAQALSEKLGPEGPQRLKSAFYFAQLALGALFVGVVWRLRSGASSRNSGFSVREADLRKAKPGLPSGGRPGQDLASARIERPVPLRLEGIRIDGSPHEILGVVIGATEEQIQKAYRERMKQYHPDKVGRPGTREWNDAQKIAEAINRAKNELLKSARGSS